MATGINFSPMDVIKLSRNTEERIPNKYTHRPIPTSFQKHSAKKPWPKHSTELDPNDIHGHLKECVILGEREVFFRLLCNCEDSFLHSKDHRNRSNIDDILRLAVENGRCDMVETLLGRGADVTISVNKLSLLEIATKSRDLDLIKVLAKYDDIKAVNVRGENLLFSTIMAEESVNTNEEIFDYLLREGVDPNQLSHNGKHPLHVAAIQSVKAIEKLSRTGCDVNVQDNILGDTPLHNACNRCCEDNIIPLLGYGANMNALNNLGQTPLEKLLAVASGSDFHSRTRRELAKRLMAIGFNVIEPKETPQRRRNKGVELYQRLQQNQSDILSLKCLCRREIRNHVSGINFNLAINKLEIPLSLRRYLCFVDGK
ncbi:hypothetical protein LOTGIDRAFT_160792 [Lottia gigantea]|uniref:SOCS box domain-containing protein n=1 Tax=Lottia gigantea TaxID=225164 RepID=V4C0Q2_LOTGI|nr:hypothetical protein LOTGIDRAFT_160792 [Lottia gigantea]ESO95029.1 hypothetical protein LOTGIDRAFT_160792 [Lottia gigantea]